MRLVKLSSLILISILIFISCQDDPTSIGQDFLLGELEIIEFNSQIDSLSQWSESFIADSINFGNSRRVLLGNLDYVKSTMLLRFTSVLSDSIITSLRNDDLQVINAQVELIPNYKIGDFNQQLNFSVHNITSNWTSFNFNNDSLANLTYDPAEVTNSKEITDSLISFNVDNSIALNWLRAMSGDPLYDNYGMIFIPQSGSNVLYGFRAFVSSSLFTDSPRLRFIVQNEENKIDTIDSRVVFDVHVPEGTPPEIEKGKFQLTAGLGQRGKLFFDLSKFPKNVNINKAELTLFVDSLHSYIGSPDVDSLRVHLLSDSINNVIDPFERLARLRFNENLFKGDVTRLIQALVSGKDNQGFSLTLSNEIEAVDRYVVFGSEYEFIESRPKLVIYYSLQQ